VLEDRPEHVSVLTDRPRKTLYLLYYAHLNSRCFARC